MWAYILAHENAVPLWRSLMGPTKVFRARHSDPDSIRGAYGLTDTRNTTHGSDSPASASREIAFFFPEFDEQRWYEQDEPRLRHGQLLYSAQERVHRVLGAQPAQVSGVTWAGRALLAWQPCGHSPRAADTELCCVPGSAGRGKQRCAAWDQIIGVTGRCWGAVGRVPPSVLMLTVWPCSSLAP